MIVDAKTRFNSISLAGLGASMYESHTELLKMAEAIGNAAGYPTTCVEYITGLPGGGYYNRTCSSKCPNGSIQTGFKADLVVESPQVFLTELAGMCAASASTPIYQQPTYTPPPTTPPPTNQQTYTPPPTTPPPTNQQTSTSPSNQSAPQKVVEELSKEASRIWKQITAGDAGSSTAQTAAGLQNSEAAVSNTEIPLWLWIIAAAGAAYLFSRKAQ